MKIMELFYGSYSYLIVTVILAIVLLFGREQLNSSFEYLVLIFLGMICFQLEGYFAKNKR